MESRRPTLGARLAHPFRKTEQKRMAQPRRRKAGQSLRDIADETRLGFQTVRTVVDKAASVDRVTLARIQRIAPEMLAEAGERSRKRTRDALPRRINAALKDCAELRKRAKGIG